ncbi:MAG: L-2-amino-thiazoline-4-carboxylic acid hydrolase [Gammaproteobacteria bacterium]|jgi:predicted hydrocarbon binding protein|nr:L-2-amino-thiazoline-4-carboxylic acid hydrolase [Gammaproteobacteria bacterium]HJP35709.1 L-2-amino-thiazoline-4-carboxylic acid hydrolase [Gammaproteobacteria bacterium]
MEPSAHAFIDPKISFLKQAKLQAQVIVPILHALRERLGKAEADELLAGALREWSREQFRRAAEAATGPKLDNWKRIWADVLEKIDDGFEMDMLAQDDTSQDFDVTRCPYAEFFRALDEPELGALLLCEPDIHLAEEVGGEDVQFARTQTIMEGAANCDFRIRLKTGGA